MGKNLNGVEISTVVLCHMGELFVLGVPFVGFYVKYSTESSHCVPLHMWLC